MSILRFKNLRLILFSLLIILSFYLLFSYQEIEQAQLSPLQQETPVLLPLDQLLLKVKIKEIKKENSPNERIGIITMYMKSAKELEPYTKKNKQQYAQRHHYGFQDGSENEELVSLIQNLNHLQTLSSKFQVLKYYQDQYDWLIWSDADALFLNHSLSLREAGLVDDQFDLVLSGGHAWDWQWGRVLNSGHFAIKTSDWGRWFIQTAIDYSDMSRGCPPNPYGPINYWLLTCGYMPATKEMGFWLGDQGLILSLIRSSKYPTDYMCHVKWLNMRDFNSEFPWVEEGDLVVHFPGRPNDQRIQIFKDWLENVDFSMGTYKPGLKNRGLVTDWRTQRGLYRDYLGAGWNVPCSKLYQTRFIH